MLERAAAPCTPAEHELQHNSDAIEPPISQQEKEEKENQSLRRDQEESLGREGQPNKTGNKQSTTRQDLPFFSSFDTGQPLLRHGRPFGADRSELRSARRGVPQENARASEAMASNLRAMAPT